MTNRQKLRSELRKRRRALTPSEQRAAARQLCRLLARDARFLRSRHIAFYLPNDGELQPTELLKLAWQRGKHCYLPVLRPFSRTLYFVRFEPATVLRPNRFGIPEPGISLRGLPPALLDLVLVPLVGFDPQGNRLGMGGGFYDRTFAFKSRNGVRKPALVGLAHSCQQVDALPVASWDVPLDAVATERTIYRFPLAAPDSMHQTEA